jgi:hypothetical protein
MSANRIEHLAEGVTLYLGDCRDHEIVNDSGPYLLSRKWTALQGRQSNSRSSTPRCIRAILRWKPPLSEACSLPPPPFLWLISNRRASSHWQRTQAIMPLPTSSIAWRRYLRSASVARPLGAFHALSRSIFGAWVRRRTSRIAPQLGHGSRPKPEDGFHVQSHLRQWVTALIGVFPQGLLMRLWRVNMPNIGDCRSLTQCQKWNLCHAD